MHRRAQSKTAMAIDSNKSSPWLPKTMTKSKDRCRPPPCRPWLTIWESMRHSCLRVLNWSMKMMWLRRSLDTRSHSWERFRASFSNLENPSSPWWTTIAPWKRKPSLNLRVLHWSKSKPSRHNNISTLATTWLQTATTKETSRPR